MASICSESIGIPATLERPLWFDNNAVGIPQARTPIARITGTAMLLPTVPWTTWDCSDKTVTLTLGHGSGHSGHSSDISSEHNGLL
jgi:hypothetical protein